MGRTYKVEYIGDKKENVTQTYVSTCCVVGEIIKIGSNFYKIKERTKDAITVSFHREMGKRPFSKE